MREPKLTHASDDEPGITRRSAGKGFAYRDPKGRVVRDPEVRARLKSLAIPPAWTEVWICADPSGHIQATGRDARGRKQYIYHPDFRAWREATKFSRMPEFALALPKLRRRVEDDLARRALSADLVLATAVRVLDRTLIRVGNDSYAAQNRTYGLTTLKESHVAHNGGNAVRITFCGKGGKPVVVKVYDRRVAAVLRRLEGIGGQRLFEYIDEAGEARRITSDDVNAYIRDATQGDFSAKDFRTWAATVQAALELLECEVTERQKLTRSMVKHALEKVARRLGNTVTVCRRSYVHPDVVDGYLDGRLAKICDDEIEAAAKRPPPGLTQEEALVLAYLRKCVAPAGRKAA